MWNDGFELRDGSYSVSDIQDHIEYIINTLPSSPPVNIYINRINIRLVFKMKDGHKLEMRGGCIEPEKDNMSKKLNFCHWQEIYPTNMGKNYWILLQKNA